MLGVGTAWTRRGAGMRRRLGAEVTFRTNTFKASSTKASSSDAGTRSLPDDKFGVFFASTDPRVFSFSPTDFAPYTAEATPANEEQLTWHGSQYLITHVAFEDIGPDTHSILVYAYRLLALP